MGVSGAMKQFQQYAFKGREPIPFTHGLECNAMYVQKIELVQYLQYLPSKKFALITKLTIVVTFYNNVVEC